MEKFDYATFYIVQVTALHSFIALKTILFLNRFFSSGYVQQLSSARFICWLSVLIYSQRRIAEIELICYSITYIAAVYFSV